MILNKKEFCRKLLHKNQEEFQDNSLKIIFNIIKGIFTII